jgi:hypothetical protein
MTQTAVRKITYPKGRMVVVRDCTVAICMNNNPGATLLSTFLFWYEHPHQFDTYQGDDFTVCRTQARIEEQACNQIDAKTIHDTAVPLLTLLGYLTVKEKMNGNLYTLHMDRITAAYTAYEQGEKALKTFLKSSLQLEAAPIRIPEDELEFVLINKRQLYLQLEKVLIAIGADSHCKRGRKPKPKAEQEAISENDRPLEREENNNRELSSPSSEQDTDAFLVPSLSLRDEESVSQSSYSHEPPAPLHDESDWLSESRGEVDIFSEDSEQTEKRPVVQGGNLAPEGKRATRESERREGTGEMRAVKPPSPGRPPASPGQAAHVRKEPTAQSTRDEKPRQPTGTPEPETSKPPLPEKTVEKGNRKKDAPLLCEPSKVRTLIDANRGYALTHNGAKINQNKVLNEWCQHFCLEHYHEVMNHLKTCRCKNPSHEWWHKDEHWRYLDADNLAKLTPGVLSELGLVPKPELPPDIPMPATPSQGNGKYHPYTRASMYEPIEIGV